MATTPKMIEETPSQQQQQQQQQQHEAVVLFYKYFLPEKHPFWHRHADFYQEKLADFQRSLCARLELKGRILLAAEGINGTLSAKTSKGIREYMQIMKEFELVRDCGGPPPVTSEPSQQQADDHDVCSDRDERLFEDMEWKLSDMNESAAKSRKQEQQPFPDLKISVVKEIVSTGGAVSLDEISRYGGKHLSPQEFYEKLTNSDNNDVVLIDVRNTFEHDIGHFVHPTTQQPAMNPETVTFSAFDDTFCARHAEQLKDKTVLMYCTGGIRCEKASVMLRKRGVTNVSQLHGGIHCYLEQYGSAGCFQGKNFVFDQRVALTPDECYRSKTTSSSTTTAAPESVDSSNQHRDLNEKQGDDKVVGKCIECAAAYDEISGSRICTVCRDLVLVCPTCQDSLREYHCNRHQSWKTCYFTFLEVFTDEELAQQEAQLASILSDSPLPSKRMSADINSDNAKSSAACLSKNVRRTLTRQIDKIQQHRAALQAGTVVALDPRDTPRRCRSCMQPRDSGCDGLCWGFWKKDPSRNAANEDGEE